MAGKLCAQQQTRFFQTPAGIKVTPWKFAEYREFALDPTAKLMQTGIDAGEAAAWTLLRAVSPAGSEARRDYMSTTIYEGAPGEPQGRPGLEKATQKAGAKMSAPVTQRNATAYRTLSQLRFGTFAYEGVNRKRETTYS